MNKKVIISEIDEKSFGKEIVNLLNKEHGKNYKGEDFFRKDYCEIYKAEIDKNNNIQLWA